jgi:phage terminase large subunit
MSDFLKRYYEEAKKAGCPRSQIENFDAADVILQPRQLLASAIARTCDYSNGPTEVGYGGARGGGKSHWLLAQMAIDDCQRFPGLKCLFLRKVGKANLEALEDLVFRILKKVKHEYTRTKGLITFPNGSRILAGHFQRDSDIDAYLGLEYDVIGVEEATTLSAKKFKDIRTCNRTSKPGWRPRIYLTTNPGGIGHAWFKQRFVMPSRLGKEGETRFVPATVADNKCVNVDYVKNLECLSGWEKRAWLHGDWDIAAGQFFTTFRRDVHVVKPIQDLEGWTLWGAFDYGYTHYTVFYLMGRHDGTTYVLDEHAERNWIVPRHGGAIKLLLKRYGLELDALDTIQAGNDVFSKKGDGKTIADAYQEEGIKLQGADDDRINGAGEITKHLGDPDLGIKPKVFITERCQRLIECLPIMAHDPNCPERVLKQDTDDDGIGGDDPYDAFRYGMMWKRKTIQQVKMRTY